MATFLSLGTLTKVLTVFLTVLVHADTLHVKVPHKEAVDKSLLSKPEHESGSRHRHRHHNLDKHSGARRHAQKENPAVFKGKKEYESTKSVPKESTNFHLPSNNTDKHTQKSGKEHPKDVAVENHQTEKQSPPQKHISPELDKHHGFHKKESVREKQEAPKEKQLNEQVGEHNKPQNFQQASETEKTEELWYTDQEGETHNLAGFFEEENATTSLLSDTNSTDFNGTSEDASSSLTTLTPFTTQQDKCPHCRLREEHKEQRKRALQYHILNMLKMEKLPNVTGRAFPKMPVLSRLYDLDSSMMADSPRVRKGGKAHHGSMHYGASHDYTYQDDDDSPVKTERIFTTARQAPLDLGLNITDSLYFSPPVQLYSSKIRKAYLWFYIKESTTKKHHITLTIERVLPESIYNKRVIAKTVHSQNLLWSKAFGWKRIEVRDLLKRWIRHPTSNYGLRIRALDAHHNNLVVLPPASAVDKGYEPWLDTKIIEPRTHSRHRRSESLMCTENSQERRCCRYPLQIGFVDLGWEWVIAPLQVRADYCSGECHMAMLDDTPRSWMTQQMLGTGTACCVPTRMQPLSLLYFDNDNNVLYQILQNVKVSKCGCA